MNLLCIRDVRDAIAKGEDDKFDMANMGVANNPPTRSCGTPACIAGWTVAYFDPNPRGGDDIIGRATVLLGLTPREAEDLFLGEYGSWELSKITKNDALEFLDRVISTNQIDRSYWNLAS